MRVQPGVTVRQLNARLLRHGRKFGPGPGQRSGLHGRRCAGQQLQRDGLRDGGEQLPHPGVGDRSAAIRHGGGHRGFGRRRAVARPGAGPLRGAVALRGRILGNPRSVAKLAQQFSMKNTMGYGLNALLEYDTPAEILDPPAGRQRGHAGLRHGRDVPDGAAAQPGRYRRCWCSTTCRGERGAARAGGHRRGDARADGRHLVAGGAGVPGLPPAVARIAVDGRPRCCWSIRAADGRGAGRADSRPQRHCSPICQPRHRSS